MRPGSPACRARSSTSGRASGDGRVSVGPRTPVLAARAPEARVQGVAEGVAQEVEGEDGGEDRDAGPDAHPPLQVGQVALRVGDVLPPRGVRRLWSEAEERQRRLGQDRDEVEGAAEVTRGEADGDAEEQADRDADEADRQTHAAPPHHAGQDVASEVVGAEPVRCPGWYERVRRDDLDRIVGSDERSEGGDEDPGHHERATDDHARIAPGERADRRGGTLAPAAERKWDGGSAHAAALTYEMRGSSHA